MKLRSSTPKSAPPLVALAAALMLTGCLTVSRGTPVPIADMTRAQIPGMPGVRSFGDADQERFIQSLVESGAQTRAFHHANPEVPIAPTVDLLAISGGGENGAYGAGILCGWTESGTRPQFRLVTGISTGALIAPLAFLGPGYDDVLHEAYTTITERDVVKLRSFFSLLRKDGLGDTEPLANLINEWMTPEMLDQIAIEHARGRRLLIATTNLEAQRPVIWDMGAIAASGAPNALALFRQVMLASASIPGAFEPQYIRVDLDGTPYTELHVDGGVISQAFLWGAGFHIADIPQNDGDAALANRPVRLWIIRNGRFHAEPELLRNIFLDIAGRSVSTLIKTQGIGDMYRLYATAQANNMQFNLTSIPETFQHDMKGSFDNAYMKALYTFAHTQITTGNPWTHLPPYMEQDGHNN